MRLGRLCALWAVLAAWAGASAASAREGGVDEAQVGVGGDPRCRSCRVCGTCACRCHKCVRVRLCEQRTAPHATTAVVDTDTASSTSASATTVGSANAARTVRSPVYCFVRVGYALVVTRMYRAIGAGYVADGGDEAMVSILEGGHYMLNKCSNITRAGKRAKQPLLIGFSSAACQHCIQFEAAYRDAAPGLADMGVTLARADAHKCHDVAASLSVDELPSIVVYRKRRHRLYLGPHTSACLAPPTYPTPRLTHCDGFRHRGSAVGLWREACGYVGCCG